MLVIGQNRNILLIYKGLFSTHGIVLDNLHFWLNNSILSCKKWKKYFLSVKSWKFCLQNM